GATQPTRCSQRRLVIRCDHSLFHARLVIVASQKFGIALEHLLFEFGGELVVAPGLADQRLGGFGVALRDERARQHHVARARLGWRVFEEAQDLRRLRVLVPKHRLRALAEHAEARPVRVRGDEGEEALAVAAAVIAAQNGPFDELARRRVGDRGGNFGRLAGAAVAQRLDGALDTRNFVGGGLRRRARRQRYLRHRGFGGRFIVLGFARGCLLSRGPRGLASGLRRGGGRAFAAVRGPRRGVVTSGEQTRASEYSNEC